MDSLLVSIVISTYRRNAMLRDSLLSLCELIKPDGVALEVLVIDNDPEGGARETTRQFVDQCSGSFELTYFHETRAGVSHARNRGIDESQGEIIAFLDDDVLVAPQWLTALLGCFNRTGADAVGGRTLVHWDGEPEAAVRSCEQQFVAIDFGEQDHALQRSQIPGGGNAAFRRGVFDDGLRFPLAMSRVGNTLVCGEDSELFRHLQFQGRSIWYCAAAVIYHRTGGERLTGTYLAQRQFWSGISYALIDRRMCGKPVQVANASARVLKTLLVLVPWWLLSIARRDRNRELLSRCYLARQLGYLRATFGSVKQVWESKSSGSQPVNQRVATRPLRNGSNQDHGAAQRQQRHNAILTKETSL
jgi:glycosyltransferase involved in cell wall biosynthesis